MKLKEFLLKGFSFNEILRQFSIDQSDFTIQDEELILSRKDLSEKEILKERVMIQGKSTNGIINFFGTLHCNFLNQLAVFELDSVEEQQQQPQISAA
ncbi:hypothetical protein [Pedobacter sp. SYSU D00535]|uniref:hypothetical protein n=1 Tax=Pedobacter sp. SYSU D00535 TaxID=2810308 RepID=UPI001A97128F|nr:hypothetical protein [Pedobacter sp. SYSU D00535]